MAANSPFTDDKLVSEEKPEPQAYVSPFTESKLVRPAAPLAPVAAPDGFPGREIGVVDTTGAMADAEPSLWDAIQETTVKYGQAARTSLIDALPGPLGTLEEQVIDVGGQIVSSPIEQVGSIFGDDNFVYDLGRAIREATRTPNEILANEALPGKFSRALLQTGAFYFGGSGVRKVFGASPKVAAATAAWLGSAVGGQAGAEDARAHGATDEQIALARWTNSAFGLSEGLPIGMAFGRIDDATGGVISKRIKSDAGRVVQAGISGAVEEGLQEAFQTWGENMTAADWSGYDPGRTWSDNLGEAAGIGGSVGLLINMLAAGMGVSTRRANRQAYTDEVAKITGPLIGIDEQMRGWLNEKAEAEERISAEAQEDTSELKTEAKWKVQETSNLLGKSLERLSMDQTEMILPAELAYSVDNHEVNAINRKIIVDARTDKEIYGTSSVKEALQKHDVVVAFDRERRISRKARAANKKDLIKLKAKKNRTELEESFLGELQLKEEAFAAREKAEKDFAEGARNLLGKAQSLLGGAKTVVTDTGARGTGGSFFTQTVNGELINVVNLNLDSYLSDVGALSSSPAKTRARKAEKFTTLLHEIGHGIAYHNFQRLYRKYKMGLTSARETSVVRALQAGYHKFLVNNLQKPVTEYLTETDAVGHLRETAEARASEFGLDRDVDDITLDQALQATLRRPIRHSNGTEKLGAEYQELITANSGAGVNYAQSAREYLAEEFAKLASDPELDLLAPEGLGFFEDVQKDIQKILNEHNNLFRGKNVGMKEFLRMHSRNGRLREAQIAQNKAVENNPLTAMVKAGIIDKALADEITSDQVVFNKFMDYGLTLLQIADRNPDVRPLQNYLQHMREWKNEVNNNLARAEQTLTEWKNLGSKEMETLGRIMLDETIGRTPDGGWLAEPRAFTVEEIETYGLSDAALELRNKIKEDFRNSLDQMEEVLVAAKMRIYAEDQQTQGKEIARVRKEFSKMKARPYFPLMRFGKYTMQVMANGDQRIDGVDYKDGKVVDYQTFDTEKERDKAWQVEKKRYVKGMVTIARGKMRKPNYSLQGMPITLIEHLESQLQSIQLPQEVKDQLTRLKNDALPFKSFRKQFSRRKRVAGYSMDAARSYANYMTSFSNHIARIKFDPLFRDDFVDMESTIKVIQSEGGNTTKRDALYNHMTDHLEYVMNPVNEFVGIRSLAFFWFLGFNVKSAFVNLTQIPLVTYPYLSKQYNPAKAAAQITRAYGTVIKLVTGKPEQSAMQINPEPKEDGDPMPPPPGATDWIVDRGAMPGEPYAFYKGDAATAEIALLAIEVEGTGKSFIEVRNKDGRTLGKYSTEKEAYAAVKKGFPSSEQHNLLDLINRGMSESWLDESLATELALAASEKNLDKSLPRHWRQRATLKISHYGSIPFHLAEKYNRHVTAVAAYRLARTKGLDHEESIVKARDAVENTQYEYARWARPRFMRGPVGGTLFVFQSYMQNTIYNLFTKDRGAVQMWFMFLLIAGVQGLPFGEDFMDLWDALATKFKRALGMKEPHTQVREDLRALLEDLGTNPDLILHGLSSSSFGFGSLGEHMNWPIPDMDLSGSLSMGRVIPGMNMVRPESSDSFDRALAKGVERTGGAVASGMMGVARALTDSHPDQWKRWEGAMPAAARQISKAARLATRGGEYTRAGNTIAEFDMTDGRDRAELIGQGLGFTPRATSQGRDDNPGWQGYIADQQSVIYYKTWRDSLLKDINYAMANKDQERVRELSTSIREYNRATVYPELKIGAETRKRSYENYVLTHKKNELNIPKYRKVQTPEEQVFKEEN